MMLWEGHALLGKRWVEISSKYFKSTRSENHIKNRWYSASFKKFIAKEFGPDAYRVGNDGGGAAVDRDRERRKVDKIVVPAIEHHHRRHHRHSEEREEEHRSPSPDGSARP